MRKVNNGLWQYAARIGAYQVGVVIEITKNTKANTKFTWG